MSAAIITAAIALVLGISALHVWAYNRKPRKRRGLYLSVLVILVIGTLFIPIDGGGGHLKTIRLWTPYYLLAIPDFYRASNREFVIDGAVIMLPLMQHFICVLLASLAVYKPNPATEP